LKPKCPHCDDEFDSEELLQKLMESHHE